MIDSILEALLMELRDRPDDQSTHAKIADWIVEHPQDALDAVSGIVNALHYMTPKSESMPDYPDWFDQWLGEDDYFDHLCSYDCPSCMGIGFGTSNGRMCPECSGYGEVYG